MISSVTAEATAKSGTISSALGTGLANGWNPTRADALLLGGVDWEAYPTDHAHLPVINLAQRVRHGDPEDARHQRLARPAIRICVRLEVADAIAHGKMRPRGPAPAIEAGVELPGELHARAQHGVFIDGIGPGQDAAAAGARARLPRPARPTHPAQRLPQALAQAQVAVTPPRATKGSYLPGLETRALGCATVVPDCVGNRAYLRADHNAPAPPLEAGALEAAVIRLQDPALRDRLTAAGPVPPVLSGSSGNAQPSTGCLPNAPPLAGSSGPLRLTPIRSRSDASPHPAPVASGTTGAPPGATRPSGV